MVLFVLGVLVVVVHVGDDGAEDERHDGGERADAVEGQGEAAELVQLRADQRACC